MLYTLERLNIRDDGLAISEVDFASIQKAHSGLQFGIRVEETFHALLENYVELEVALLEVNVRGIVYSPTSRADSEEDVQAINRRLGNFLSTAKSYLDSVKHELSRNLPNGKQAKDAFADACKGEETRGLAFPVLQLIRDHHQHERQSVHNLTFQIRREEAGGQVFAAHFVAPAVSIEDLARNLRKQSPALGKLRLQGEFVDLFPMIREYVAALGRLHEGARGHIAPSMKTWVGALQAVLQRGRAHFPGVASFRAVARSDDDPSKQVEEIFVTEALPARLDLLRRKTLHVPHLANHYASGKPSHEPEPTDENPPALPRDGLGDFVRSVETNGRLVAWRVPALWDRWSKLDSLFVAASKMDTPDEYRLIGAVFVAGSHSAFRAAVRLASGGSPLEVHASLRLCLEFALYARVVATNPPALDVWMNRNDDHEAKRACKQEFTVARCMSTLEAVDAQLAQLSRRMYEHLIDHGAHPNTAGVSSVLQVSLGSDGFTTNLLQGVLWTVAARNAGILTSDVGVLTLKIFETIFSGEFESRGISRTLDGLAPALAKPKK
jgi:hypothetical protein